MITLVRRNRSWASRLVRHRDEGYTHRSTFPLSTRSTPGYTTVPKSNRAWSAPLPRLLLGANDVAIPVLAWELLWSVLVAVNVIFTPHGRSSYITGRDLPMYTLSPHTFTRAYPHTSSPLPNPSHVRASFSFPITSPPKFIKFEINCGFTIEHLYQALSSSLLFQAGLEIALPHPRKVNLFIVFVDPSCRFHTISQGGCITVRSSPLPQTLLRPEPSPFSLQLRQSVFGFSTYTLRFSSLRSTGRHRQ